MGDKFEKIQILVLLVDSEHEVMKIPNPNCRRQKWLWNLE